MSKERIEYDAKKKIIKVYPEFRSPKTLVPKEKLKHWTSIKKAGEDEQGRPVKAIRFIFSDKKAAEYNSQPISFAGLETYIDEGSGEETPFGDKTKFPPREDFGIDGGE